MNSASNQSSADIAQPGQIHSENQFDDKAFVETVLWQRLATSTNPEEFYLSWLELQAGQINGCHVGLVLAETDAEKTYAPVAIWPNESSAGEALIDVAKECLEDGEAIVVDLEIEYSQRYPVRPGSTGLAFPLIISDQTACVVALEVLQTDPEELPRIMRQLQWGVSWLEAFYLRYQASEDESTIDRLVTALYLTSAASRESSCKEATTYLVAELATRLDCERVSCGFIDGRRMKVESLSHSGQFGRQMNLVNSIGKAMEEAAQQNSVINYPDATGSGRITHQHQNLAMLQNGGAILTVPLVAEGRNIGAITLERSIAESFDEDTAQLCETVGTIIGPILAEKKKNDRWIFTKIKDSTATQLARLIGPRYIGRKLFVASTVIAIASLYYAKGDFNIVADMVLEGAERRAVVTPYDGFVSVSNKRVGDTVKTGDTLAALDDTDLRLDLVEVISTKAQAQSQYDEAVATYDRAKAKVFKAKVEQSEANERLINEKLKRTTLQSPLDGIIVKGDLSQSLGAAVNRGEVLFEISSLFKYRVNFRVDERDIDHVKPGQNAKILLSALPSKEIEVTVDSITPLTSAADGRNFFRVDASLSDQEGNLRPGMEGVAKIRVAERRYVWIWTRELFNWVKLWLWRWTD
ncbi:MAG: efflux RND transporter periplasmic adaptor subunit [Acidiferrobacterales bacterium]|nr:efflux RND transporter periplasmic adaptor subunit [Acidiferrobacterales bacterium]